MISLFPSALAINLPAGISLVVLIGLFVAGISERRQGHIGRVAIFLNALLLWEIFFAVFSTLPLLLQVYLNLGTFIGIIALASYAIRRSLPTEFYTFAYIFYGSISLVVAILGAIFFKISLF